MMLVVALRKLADLLDDPQPGLVSWHESCERLSREVERLIREARGE